MKRALKWMVLYVASMVYASLLSHAAVIRGIELGTSRQRRPLASFPLWWVGFWALDAPAKSSPPGYRRMYAAACLELSMRRQEAETRAAMAAFVNEIPPR